MLLNKTTSNAVKVLVACAQAGDAMVKVAELAGSLDLTQQNTFKIVHLLSRAGFVAATRGRNGGVTLALPASEILVGEVVRAMEYSNRDALLQGTELQQNVALSRLEDEALEAFISVLNQSTIEDMALSSGQKRKKAASNAQARVQQKRTLKLAVDGQKSSKRTATCRS